MQHGIATHWRPCTAVLIALLLSACGGAPATTPQKNQASQQQAGKGQPRAPKATTETGAPENEDATPVAVVIPPTLEESIVREINLARSSPTRYVALLKKRLRHYRGKRLRLPGSKRANITKEGVTPVRELIATLTKADPIAALFRTALLDRASLGHASDLGSTGRRSHVGSDGSFADQRLSRYGRWQGAVAESITIGPDNAREVVMRILISDGISGRAQRNKLLDPKFRVIGVSCVPHQRRRIVCVIVYATDFRER